MTPSAGSQISLDLFRQLLEGHTRLREGTEEGDVKKELAQLLENCSQASLLSKAGQRGRDSPKFTE